MDLDTATVTFENLKTMSKSQGVFVVLMPQKKILRFLFFLPLAHQLSTILLESFPPPAKARAFLPVFSLCPNDGVEEDGVLVAVPTTITDVLLVIYGRIAESQTEGRLLLQGFVALQDACNRACFHLFCLARWLFILQLREVIRFQILKRKRVRYFTRLFLTEP